MLSAAYITISSFVTSALSAASTIASSIAAKLGLATAVTAVKSAIVAAPIWWMSAAAAVSAWLGAHLPFTAPAVVPFSQKVFFLTIWVKGSMIIAAGWTIAAALVIWAAYYAVTHHTVSKVKATIYDFAHRRQAAAA